MQGPEGNMPMEHLRYPGESADYRAARNALLDDEIALRAQIEAVAARRRALPPGGKVPEDYVFERIGPDAGMPQMVKMSELFGSHDTLILYSFMFGPERRAPCPGCTHLLDGIDGAARHLPQRVAFHVVAKSPIARLAAWAHKRGWEHLSLLSTAGNRYDADYFGDTSKLSPGMRAQFGVKDGENWDETISTSFTAAATASAISGARSWPSCRPRRARTTAPETWPTHCGICWT